MHLDFGELILRLSARFISLAVENIDDGIQRALEEIGRFAEVDRSYVFRFSADARTFSYTHEWCGPGIEPEIGRIQNQPVCNYPWALPRLLRGERIHVPRVADCPPEAAAERAEWEAELIRSLVLVPMRLGDRFVGFVGFDSVAAEKTWSPEHIALLAIFADMVANVLHRRDAELGQRRQARALALANAELERRNGELQQFTYVASHDLQEPLRSIAGFAALLQRRYGGRLDQQADVYIRYLTEATARLHHLIGDLLEYSRLDADDVRFDACELSAVLDVALANLDAAVRASRAVVTRAALPAVAGDAGQLTQLLQNLVGNAIKFRSSAPPRIHVWAQAHDGAWEIAVRDDGIGMSRDDTQRIFQLFRRLHGNDEYSGTGIGLAVCKRIVERHRGRIWAEANPDRGCTFRFTLPAASTAAATALAAAAAS